jgi:hypothetical protein
MDFILNTSQDEDRTTASVDNVFSPEGSSTTLSHQELMLLFQNVNMVLIALAIVLTIAIAVNFHKPLMNKLWVIF